MLFKKIIDFFVIISKRLSNLMLINICSRFWIYDCIIKSIIKWLWSIKKLHFLMKFFNEGKIFMQKRIFFKLIKDNDF